MNLKINCPVVILAGGKSSRMGEDKSLLPFGSYNTLCEYQFSKYKSLFSKVYISAKENKFDFVRDLNIIKDTMKEFSPLNALKSIFSNLDDSYVFIISVDVPLLKVETIEKLYKEFINNDLMVVYPKDNLGDAHYLCGFFHRDIRGSIDELLNNNTHKISKLLDKTDSLGVHFDDNEQFLNLNDKETYKKACNTFIKI